MYIEIVVSITALASVGNYLLQRRWYKESSNEESKR